jgi:hypothetical protein
LEEAGDELVGELVEAKLLKEEAEQQFSEEIVELEFTGEWQVKATTNGEYGMGDLVDLPTCREEV